MRQDYPPEVMKEIFIQSIKKNEHKKAILCLVDTVKEVINPFSSKKTVDIIVDYFNNKATIQDIQDEIKKIEKMDISIMSYNEYDSVHIAKHIAEIVIYMYNNPNDVGIGSLAWLVVLRANKYSFHYNDHFEHLQRMYKTMKKHFPFDELFPI